MDYTKIIIKPLISEKATLIKELANKVVFLIHPGANKLEVKRAVEEAFKVKVQSVGILRRRSRPRTKFGRTVGKISGYKKAYVTLSPGEKIEFFEGV